MLRVKLRERKRPECVIRLLYFAILTLPEG
jgi:hypothetical protein